MTDLVKGVVPRSWRAYKVPDAITANQWIADFGQRVDQLLTLTRSAAEGHDLRVRSVHGICILTESDDLDEHGDTEAQRHGEKEFLYFSLCLCASVSLC